METVGPEAMHTMKPVPTFYVKNISPRLVFGGKDC